MVGGVRAEWYNPIIGLFYESPYWNLFPHNNPLWFIPSLLAIEIIACFCSGLTKMKKYAIGVFLVLISTYFSAKQILLPFGLLMAFCCILFFFLGSEVFKLNRLSKFKLSVLFTVCFLLVCCIVFFEGYATTFTLFHPSLKYIFKWYLIALLTIGAIVLLAKFIEPFLLKMDKLQKMTTYIGVNTLVILCIHDPLKRAIIFVYSKLTNLEIEYIRSSFFDSMVCLVLVFLIMIPCIWGYNKYVKPQLYKL